MAKVYAELIRKGLKTMEQVPVYIRSRVEEILHAEFKAHYE